jgi:hypothetical protein
MENAKIYTVRNSLNVLEINSSNITGLQAEKTEIKSIPISESVVTSESIANQYKLTDWEFINKQVYELQWVSVDIDIDSEIFPYGKGIKKIADIPIDSKSHYLIYEKDKGYTKIRVEGALPVNEGLVFSKNTFKTYLVINAYAYTEKALNPIIRKQDLAKRLGADKNPNIYKNIPGYIEFLAKASYTIEDKKNKTREWGHIVNYAKEINTDSKAKDSYFYIELNPHCHEYLQAHIEDQEELPQYVKYPIDYKQSRNNAISNMLMRLQGIAKTYEYSIKKLLQKIGLSENEITIKGINYLAESVDKSLSNLPEGWSWTIGDRQMEKMRSINKYINLQSLAKLIRKGAGLEGVIYEFVLAEKRIREKGITETFMKFTKQNFLKLKIIFLNSKAKISR